MSVWKNKYIFGIFFCTIIVFSLISILYYDKLVELNFIWFGLLIIVLFFSCLKLFSETWIRFTPVEFIRKIFLYSLVIRIISAVGFYFFYIYVTGIPFEYNAVDSLFYDYYGQIVSLKFSQGEFSINNLMPELSFSDKGYNIYMGSIYYIFGHYIIIPRLLNALYSAITVVLIYKTSQLVYDEVSSRIAGIMAMLLPNFIFYVGLHLKETLMVFIIILALYTAIKIIKYERRTISNLLILIISLFILFMLRTVLGSIVLISFLFYAIIYQPKRFKILNTLAVFVVIIIFGIIAMNTEIGNEIQYYIEKSTSNLSDTMEFKASRSGGNKYALLAGAPLFILIILICPFPSMVYVAEQENIWLFMSGNYIRNIYAFFTIIGLIYCLKYLRKESALFVSFLIGYLAILANSGFALSERFHLPVVPVLLIFAGFGVTNINPKQLKYYSLYLMLIVVLILGWNYVKISGRV